MARVLVVDDDPPLREVARYALSREHEVTEASNGEEALQRVAESSPDLMVLDVLMPELDGFETLRRLRAEGHRFPVLFLSSRAEEMDRVMGLDLGGDDYMAKPFSPRELCSRVRALLRRTLAPVADPAGVRVDADARRAWVGDDELMLTRTEFDFLAAFLSAPGTAFSRRALVTRAMGKAHHVSDRTVDSHIRNLRRKLSEAGNASIVTVHGVGFRFEPR